MAKQSKYASYEDVPVFRKQWFFWLVYCLFSPVAILILLFGDIYYVKNNEVESFGVANRIVAGIIALPLATLPLQLLAILIKGN